MSGIEVREVTDRAGRRRWVEFPLVHYRGHACYVPPLLSDELAYFDPAANPAFDANTVAMFLALRGSQPVGRVCGIINHAEATKLGRKVGRFGWLDSVEDDDVAWALLERVRDWLRDHGCVDMVGPLGFTDFDPSGIMVDGFDEIPTIAGRYNEAHQQRQVEEFGLTKKIDFVEYRMDISRPIALLERMRRRLEHEPYRVETPTSRKELLGLAPEFWSLLEESYRDLFGVVPLTAEQREFYAKKYLRYLDPDFVQLGYAHSGEFIGVLIGMPNLSASFRRAWGRLLPTGWFHVYREYRKPSTVDLLLAALKPGEPGTVIVTLGLVKMYDVLRRRGVRFLETNRELETNTAVNRLWRRFDVVARRRSRVYELSLEG